MLRKLTILLLAITCACGPATQPAPTVTPAVTLTATIETATPIPVVTLTLVPVPSVTVQPTPDVPIGELHPRAIAVGEINVLEAYCYSTTTTIYEYYWGVQWVENDDARKACIERGQV